MKNSKQDTIDLAREYDKQGKPNGWFEEFYARAEGDHRKIYWADLAVNPKLSQWLADNPSQVGQKAITVGCGLGDDAEFLASLGYRVTAFDISSSAIDMCLKRFPETKVNYCVADLFNCSAGWKIGFDLVYECNTIQILTGRQREDSCAAIANLVAHGGSLLVSCRSRESGQGLDEFPVAVDRHEIDGFKRVGLQESLLEAYDDDQDPPVPHFFAVYCRS